MVNLGSMDTSTDTSINTSTDTQYHLSLNSQQGSASDALNSKNQKKSNPSSIESRLLNDQSLESSNQAVEKPSELNINNDIGHNDNNKNDFNKNSALISPNSSHHEQDPVKPQDYISPASATTSTFQSHNNYNNMPSTPTKPGSATASKLTSPPALLLTNNTLNTTRRVPSSTSLPLTPVLHSFTDNSHHNSSSSPKEKRFPDLIVNRHARKESFDSLGTNDSSIMLASSGGSIKSTSTNASLASTPLLSPTKSSSSLVSLDDSVMMKKHRRRSKLAAMGPLGTSGPVSLSNDSVESLKLPRTPRRSATPETRPSHSKSSSCSTPKSRSSTPSSRPRPSDGTHRRRRSSAASVSSINSDADSYILNVQNQNYNPNNTSSTTTTSIPVPDHPANIYRNLLIMEDTYRQEYATHKKMRRKYILFNFVMMTLCVSFFYTVFIEPSNYGVIHFINRLVLMVVVITIILFYISGSYHKTLGSTRKFIYNSNKAMRGFNVKLVKIPQTWAEACVDWFWWSPAYSKRPGKIVKLVLSPRVFNSEIIEGWELYRMEYWDKEYLRRQNKSLSGTSSLSSSSAPFSSSSAAANGSSLNGVNGPSISNGPANRSGSARKGSMASIRSEKGLK